jgi:CheY-like chemotaxis protein
MVAPAKRILVVDDDDTLRMLEAEIVVQAGYTTEVAESGAVALDRLSRPAFDLVLLDLQMPGVSGWDVLSFLAARPSPPAVILISGMTVEDVRRGPQYPFVAGHLLKPFRGAELLEMCARALADADLESRRCFARS